MARNLTPLPNNDRADRAAFSGLPAGSGKVIQGFTNDSTLKNAGFTLDRLAHSW